MFLRYLTSPAQVSMYGVRSRRLEGAANKEPSPPKLLEIMGQSDARSKWEAWKVIRQPSASDFRRSAFAAPN